MGDRANIVMHSEEGRVYFYTHWSGTELPSILSTALSRGKERWDDPAYLGRIIFCQMIGKGCNELTGFGISSFLTDNEYPLIIVDVEKQEIRFEGDIRKSWTCNKPCIGKTFSFVDYVSLNLQSDSGWSVLNNELTIA